MRFKNYLIAGAMVIGGWLCQPIVAESLSGRSPEDVERGMVFNLLDEDVKLFKNPRVRMHVDGGRQSVTPLRNRSGAPPVKGATCVLPEMMTPLLSLSGQPMNISFQFCRMATSSVLTEVDVMLGMIIIMLAIPRFSGWYCPLSTIMMLRPGSWSRLGIWIKGA